MKFNALIAALLFISVNSYAQISSRSIPVQQPPKQLEPEVYDSLHNIDLNYDKNFKQYVGQEIYVCPKSTGREQHTNEREDYASFTLKPIVQDANAAISTKYHPKEFIMVGYVTDPAAVEGKYFKILALEEYKGKYDAVKKYFKIQEKETGDVLYYCIKRNDYKPDNVRLLVVGYFEKIKQTHLNNVYVYNGKYDNDALDLNTGAKVKVQPNSEWQCVDVTTLDRDFLTAHIPVYILKNAAGNEIPVAIERSEALSVSIDKFITKEAYEIATAKDAEEKALRDAEYKKREEQEAAEEDAAKKQRKDEMIKKYGTTNGTLIAAGQVKVGMTASMCKAAWGEPTDINRTTNSYGVSEQWVYSHTSYLYFKDGILTSIQN